MTNEQQATVNQIGAHRVFINAGPGAAEMSYWSARFYLFRALGHSRRDAAKLADGLDV